MSICLMPSWPPNSRQWKEQPPMVKRSTVWPYVQQYSKTINICLQLTDESRLFMGNWAPIPSVSTLCLLIFKHGDISKPKGLFLKLMCFVIMYRMLVCYCVLMTNINSAFALTLRLLNMQMSCWAACLWVVHDANEEFYTCQTWLIVNSEPNYFFLFIRPEIALFR